jgi:hypothetical protein
MPSSAVALVLAAGLAACSASRRAPPPGALPPEPVSEDAPPRKDPKRPSNEPPAAPPPAYGHRVALRDVAREPSERPASGTRDTREPEIAASVACVVFWPEVRFRSYAYDHVVHLLSRCDVRATCEVSSNVNPTAVEVELRPQEHAEVLTFRGSPASEFEPHVACRLFR